ncbi:MAG: helix-turn-helix transcriptional regulator [Caulobacterales bacterium]|nr:helix-turn-helix transcriptional regulator [Caulobacterales bacterium]
MSDPVDIMVGRRLRRRRRLLGMTQQDLADVCGVSFQQVQKYECAYNRMSVAMLWKLACALRVDVAYFFEGLAPELDVRTHADCAAEAA